jgi:hypothetical protein
MPRDWAHEERLVREGLARAPGDPNLTAALGQCLLGQGRWAEGFRLRTAWRADPATAAIVDNAFPFPTWSGEDLRGKDFLVCSEEPFGDEIMWLRFGRRLAALGAKVTWLTHPELVRLFRACAGIEAFPLRGGIKLGRFDFYAPSGELPALFFPPLVEPPGEPYLAPPPANVIEGLTIGVVASGNPKHANDAHRSLPPDQARRLMDLPGAVSLAPADTGARDFYDTVTVVAGLDLVITVDTSVAHLAGAMGKPVWILLPAEGTDWRWMSAGSETPWYASARLFRQVEAGGWPALVDRVVEAARAAASAA